MGYHTDSDGRIDIDRGEPDAFSTWRKIRQADCQRGVLVRLTNMSDAIYNGATIIAVTTVGNTVPSTEITLARPYAYAHEHFDSKQPLIGCEVFSLSIKDGTFTDLEVYQARDGKLRMMST